MIIDMGRIYWSIDKTTSSFDALKETLEKFGLVAVNQRPLGREFGFNRVIDWKSKNGISFSTIWFINLCTIRFGKEDEDFAEVTFDRIEGSYCPYCDHDTIDFVRNGNTVFKIALKRGNV